MKLTSDGRLIDSNNETDFTSPEAKRAIATIFNCMDCTSEYNFTVSLEKLSNILIGLANQELQMGTIQIDKILDSMFGDSKKSSRPSVKEPWDKTLPGCTSADAYAHDINKVLEQENYR